ncbi:MAG: hypothetical protein NVS3B20_02670 [Polyangiales bacterium]
MTQTSTKSAQAQEHNEPGNREELRTVLKGFHEAMLVTRDSSGLPRARPMAVLTHEADSSLWFATNHDSPKVHEIEHDPLVAAVFTRESDRAWVSVSGRGALIRSPERAKELWSVGLQAWFSGPDDPSLLLIRVEPHHAEYFEPKGTKVSRMFELVKGALTGSAPDMGNVKHVNRVELTRKS